jgi:hypothetical protein
MARSSVLEGMTIAQLEQIIATRQDRLKKLSRQRDLMQRELDKLDEAITRLSGRGVAGRTATLAIVATR